MPTTAAPTLNGAQRAFLEPPRVAVGATAGEDGAPHQATVWFRLEPDGSIMLNGRVARRWSRELRASGRISLAVLDPDDTYRWLGLEAGLESLDDDPARGLEGIMELHRRYHDGGAGPEVEAAYATHPRVTFHVRITRIHDHLGDG